MKKESGEFLLSPSDLTKHLSCQHVTQLQRAVAEGRLVKPQRENPRLDLLIQEGEIHERNYLEHLRSTLGEIVAIRSFAREALEETLVAMRSGAPAIAQACLVDGPWRGRPDFLIKVDEPSQLGAWSYEVADAKLSFSTKVSAVLQLSVYSGILGALQGRVPRWMYVVKPGQPFEVDRLRVDDFAAFCRFVKRRLEEVIRQPPNHGSYPEPCTLPGVRVVAPLQRSVAGRRSLEFCRWYLQVTDSGTFRS